LRKRHEVDLGYYG